MSLSIYNKKLGEISDNYSVKWIASEEYGERQGEEHLQNYLNEFSFRYNHRDASLSYLMFSRFRCFFQYLKET